MADSPDDLGIPMKPARPIGASASLATVGRTPAAVPPRVTESTRSDPPRSVETSRRMGEALGASAAPPPATLPTSTSRREAGLRQLMVGREITLSGDISSCDTLIVEGTVEASLQNCRDIDIAEHGRFKGTAEVENADVRGVFEGNLTIRKRLLIRSGGLISGTIRYGQIEIELGGQIVGDIKLINENADVIAELSNARAAS